MENRVITLEVQMDQTMKSAALVNPSIIDLCTSLEKTFIRFENNLDRNFDRLENNINRKFCWIISIQITGMLSMLAFMGKIAQIY